ncbi:MAG TPA: DUF3488 and transglutaminase-like domain-containing protein [Terriglobales bacterium]|nr:DUF3488 and transglutaminase-like domain-containing protein [Terriglobales bacterium]
MPASPQSGAPPVHPVIQRFFEVSLYLLLFTGFAMLAGTGKLDALSLVLVLFALLLKAVLLLKRNDARIPEELTNYLTLLYVIFFALDYFFVSQTFIGALVHMVLFAAMVKIFSIHRERDYVYLAVLSFGMVLAAAVLTVDSLFFAIFCLFVLLAVTTFVSMEMRRSWIAGQSLSTELPHARDLSRLPASVSRACILLVLSIVIGTVILFFVIPRKPSSGYLSEFASHSEIATGFSEEVKLGEIGRIQQSQQVVMHVKFAQGTRVPRDLRWRGVALTTFDGKSWSGPKEDAENEFNSGTFPLGANQGSSRLFIGGGRNVGYKVSLEPFGSRVFFVLPQALWINGRYQTVRIDSTGSLFNIDPTRAVSDYTVVSELPPAMPASVPALSQDRVNRIIYLQLPAQLDPRVRQLAKKISSDQPTAFLKASAIERYLASHYGYTLQLPAVAPPDPIANFLFDRKKGHCEYFASAMVLMLRTLGIPARIINGFRGGEYNDLTGSYIVRARDAHSWVEAHFPGYGWYTFDPTPGSAGVSGTWNRFSLYADAMREFWHDWIVNYDSGHQNELGLALVRNSHTKLQSFRAWSMALYEKSVREAKGLRVHFRTHVNAWITWAGAIFLVFVSLAFWRRGYLALRRFRLARKPHLEPHSAATIWYARLLKLLARRGISKSPAQTSQEFIGKISSAAVRRQVELFTVHYERARFGDSPEDAERLPELYRNLEEVVTMDR